MDNKGSNGFLIGAIIGGLAGAAVALMMAPQEGKETRKVVKAKTKEVLQKATEKFGDFKEESLDPIIADLQKDLEKKFTEAKNEMSAKVKKSTAKK